MKTKLLLSFFIFVLVNNLFPQNTNSSESLPNCISSDQYKLLEERCAINSLALGINQSNLPHNNKAGTPLSWPLKAKASLNDCSFYHISAYVDQNTAAGSFKDFNCGTNSYDGHGGTDISIWPFNFLKMDSSLVQIVAAAPGIILAKHDGEFDKNCTANTLTANYVVIQHADGSRANYWHMKKNSVLSKAIGQSVAAGEYLGLVGSSGSSSGPHLHFEVWSGATSATRVDPYSGSCNSLNANSWWAAQKTYKETAVVKVSVNTTDVLIPACPGTEISNEAKVFQVPFQGPGLPAGFAKFYMFLRDEVTGGIGDMKIKNPDGSTFVSWTYSSTTDKKNLMWGWSKKLPTVPGKYTFEVNYNGSSCSALFEITNATGIPQLANERKFLVYPNPSNGLVFFEGVFNSEMQIEIYSDNGELVYLDTPKSTYNNLTITLQKGLFFYRMKSSNELFQSGKLLIE
jgi:hypothetical protein